MKIDNSTRAASILGESPATRNAKQAPRQESQGARQERVQLSSVSAQIQALESSLAEASGFDTAKVESIKQAISENRYSINAEVIADKLISATREFLAQKS